MSPSGPLSPSHLFISYLPIPTDGIGRSSSKKNRRRRRRERWRSIAPSATAPTNASTPSTAMLSTSSSAPSLSTRARLLLSSLFSLLSSYLSHLPISISSPYLFSSSFKEVAFSFNGGKDSTVNSLQSPLPSLPPLSTSISISNLCSQVLLHLLRAAYYRHNHTADNCNAAAAAADHFNSCPIRTIYFETPCAFPEINSFTYETASM